MLILAFDTATDECTVALEKDGVLLGEVNLYAPRSHMEKLLPLIDNSLKQANYAIKDIESIVVGLGPGSFTGIRIGVSTARGLAQALGKPVFGVSTSDCLAYPFVFLNSLICVVLDAKRKEVYATIYEGSNGSLKRLTDYQVTIPEDLCAVLKKEKQSLIIVGDGLRVYGELFKDNLKEAHFADESYWFPRAANLITLARPKFSLGKGDYNELTPIYARLPQAEEMWLKRELR